MGLGPAHSPPPQTRHTNSERIRQDRLQAHAVEAAEQCGATFVPEVTDLQHLDKLLAKWPEDRALLWCDEASAGMPPSPPRGGRMGRGGAPSPSGLPPAPAAILIGPEGGFSVDEAAKLRSRPNVTPISLGPRILRADTAAVAALTLWQAASGDWR